MAIRNTLVAAAVALLALAGAGSPAEARNGFSLYIGGPGFSFGFGGYPRYYYDDDPYHILPYPYPRYPRYYQSPRNQGGGCAYWSRRCAANWGYGNRNYRGCMRYYGC